VVVALFVAAGLGGVRAAPTRTSTEYAVKAAFLYNFAKFVDWPDAPSQADFVLVVLGEDPFGPVLDDLLRDKKVMQRPFAVRRVRALQEPPRADIVFIGSSEAGRLSEILSRLEGTSILTVSEADDFVRRGGMVGLQLKDDVVRFDVNLGQVKRARLRMSSQLLRLARTVLDEEDRP
jgi:hypothetical protein